MSEALGGINSVKEALKARPEFFEKILVTKGKHSPALKELIQLARKLKIKLSQEDKSRLDNVFKGSNHQGVVALVGEYAYHDLDEILSGVDQTDALILVLDGIQDPMNLGSLLRTAESAGASGVVIPRERAAAVTSTALKASAGAGEHIPVSRVVNLVRAIEAIKKAGFWVIGTDAKAEISLYDQELKSRIALVIGGEGTGIRRLVGEACDSLVFIPQKGKVSSLNAGAAGAVAMFEFVRQTNKS